MACTKKNFQTSIRGCYRTNKFYEDDLNEYIDSAYDADTYQWDILGSISEEYEFPCGCQLPKKFDKRRIRKMIKDLAEWTVQDTSTPEAKAIRKMAGKYADAYVAFLTKHWKYILKLSS